MNKTIIYSLLACIILTSCLSGKKKEDGDKSSLTTLAVSDKQWTGVAVSRSNRIFVNYPYWSSNVPVSVAEIIDGIPRAYPDMEWNQRTSELSFNAVQAVYIDNINRLWVLDTNNPQFKGVNKTGPQLYHFRLETNDIVKIYSFPEGIYTNNSYFNDVRIDTEKNIAYMTDSGDGAIITLNLTTGQSQRLLDDHPSTEAETDYLICDGQRWENSVHSDGIALSPDNEYLYFIPLTGHTLYRIATQTLLDEAIAPEVLNSKVEVVTKIPATDVMLFDKKGNLYLGGLETNSVNRLAPDGTVKTVLQSPRIRWADSFSMDIKGNLYFTTSQIHIPEKERGKYEILKLALD